MQDTGNAGLIDRILSHSETRVGSAWIGKALGVNTSTAFRWMAKGVITPRGRIKLESAMIGGRLCSTREAVNRFTAAIEAARTGGHTEQPPARTPLKREKAAESAEQELIAIGA